MATTVTAAEAQDKLSDLLNQVTHSKERVLITRRGKEIAALIPLEDFALLQEQQNKRDLHEAVDALKEAREKGSTPIEKIKEELGS